MAINDVQRSANNKSEALRASNGDLSPRDHDDQIDEAVDESFPASDPPSQTPMTGAQSKPDRATNRRAKAAAMKTSAASPKSESRARADKSVSDLRYALSRARVLVKDLKGGKQDASPAKKATAKPAPAVAKKTSKPATAAPSTKPSPKARAADPSKAPGKQHRKPPMSLKGVKHSRMTIAKARTGLSLRRQTRG